MAKTRIRRKDLKRPDEFVTLSARVLVKLREHGRVVAWTGGAALLVLAGVGGFMALRTAKLRDANADLERREQSPQAATVVLGRVREQLDTSARGRAQVAALERGSQLLRLALGPLQREVQAPAPFAERGVRLREQPWDRVDAREIGAAPRAAQP